MAVPKRKTSKTVRNSRRAHKNLTPRSHVECPQCKEPKLPHRLCANCGFYNDREVIKEEVEAEETTE